MRGSLLAFLAALGLSVGAVPIARLLGKRWGALSHPGGRNVHHVAVPRTGGLAIAFGHVVALLFLILLDQPARTAFLENRRPAIGVLAGALFIALVGAIDDVRRLPATYKLAAQVAAAATAWAFGLRIESVALPVLGSMSMGIFSLPMTILWVVGIVNAVNLIDGLDGLAGGVVFFAAFTNFAVAYLNQSWFVALLMAGMLGATLGFLVFNFNPARIFMGDSGSYYLGYVLSTSALVASSQKASTAISLLVPIVALGVPIVDTLLAMLRRILEKRPIFSPDRGHIHHRLLDMGITHRRVVLIIYAVCVAFTVSALGISFGRSWQAGLALIAASAIAFGLVRFSGYFDYLGGLGRGTRRAACRRSDAIRGALVSNLAELQDACDKEAFLAVFRSLLRSDGIEAVEWIVDGTPTDRVTTAEFEQEASLELVCSSCPIGETNQELRFYWRGDDTSASADALLQLVADIVLSKLARKHPVVSPAKQPQAAVERHSWSQVSTEEQ